MLTKELLLKLIKYPFLFKDCHIYPFQYGADDSRANEFWESLAFITYSHRIHLAGTENTLLLILAVVYREKGGRLYEASGLDRDRWGLDLSKALTLFKQNACV